MKAAEIKEGSHYVAKISAGMAILKVDLITEDKRRAPNGGWRSATRYMCTNIRTGRGIIIKSAMKFRSEVTQEQIDDRTRRALHELPDPCPTVPSDTLKLSGNMRTIPLREEDRKEDPAQAMIDELAAHMNSILHIATGAPHAELTSLEKVQLSDIVKKHLQGMELERMATN